MHLSDEHIRELELKASHIREAVIRMLVSAGSGHTAGPLGMADIFSALYFHVLKHKPRDPLWEGRDRLILSNGHITPVRYAALALSGYFEMPLLMTLRKFGSPLQGHPERERFPGVETTSGPLGSGLSQAAGIALGLRLDNRKERVFCIMSDGEQQAGNTWEAAMFAAAHSLANLTAILDRNHIQINGPTEEVMPLEPLRAKYEAFGWYVFEVDGHNIREFIEAAEEARAVFERPTLILAHTIPGKGVREIEGDYLWHGKPPSPEEGERFLREIIAEREILRTRL